MPLYLKADCVFSFLINENIFSKKDWKNINSGTVKYNTSFEKCTDDFKICSFEVSIISGIHCILANQLYLIVKKFGIYDKAEKLFDDCALSDIQKY